MRQNSLTVFLISSLETGLLRLNNLSGASLNKLCFSRKLCILSNFSNLFVYSWAKISIHYYNFFIVIVICFLPLLKKFCVFVVSSTFSCGLLLCNKPLYISVA